MKKLYFWIRIFMLASLLAVLFLPEDFLLAIVSAWSIFTLILLAIFFALALATIVKFAWIHYSYKMKRLKRVLNFTFSKLFPGGLKNEH